jgi:hypothetical protein
MRRPVMAPRPPWLVEADGCVGQRVVVVTGVRRRVALWVAAMVGGRIKVDDGRRNLERLQQSLPFLQW